MPFRAEIHPLKNNNNSLRKSKYGGTPRSLTHSLTDWVLFFFVRLILVNRRKREKVGKVRSLRPLNLLWASGDPSLRLAFRSYKITHRETDPQSDSDPRSLHLFNFNASLQSQFLRTHLSKQFPPLFVSGLHVAYFYRALMKLDPDGRVKIAFSFLTYYCCISENNPVSWTAWGSKHRGTAGTYKCKCKGWRHAISISSFLRRVIRPSLSLSLSTQNPQI